MLVQQTAKFLHQQKQPLILLKLDISKAFDSVSWPFLLEILRHLGFGQISRDIISGLLYTSTTQVLMNGVPGDRISHRRGLRQGDPLSPMLFILVMDVLGHMILKAADEGLLQPLSRRVFKHRVSIYADDVVLFLRPTAEDIEVIMDILSLFGEATGLNTNLQKSNVLPIRFEALILQMFKIYYPVLLRIFHANIWVCPFPLRDLLRNKYNHTLTELQINFRDGKQI
jgi:hypothetical protein